MVTIGEQVWIAENLNYPTAEGSYCYNDDPDNCDTYGRLYTWDAAREACPSGWHIPNADETSWMIAQMNELKNYMPADSGHFESGASLQQYQYPKQSGYWTARLYSNTTAYTIHWASTGKAYTTYTGDIKDGFYLRCFRD